MSVLADQLKTLPAPTVKKRLREAGWNMALVAAVAPARSPSLVQRVIRKEIPSAPMWERIAWCLANPRKHEPGRRRRVRASIHA
jgi:hypothetical protein